MFGAFREMWEIRDFRLVLHADVVDYIRGHAVRELRRAVSMEQEKWGMGDLSSKLSVTTPSGLHQRRSFFHEDSYI